LTSGGLSLPPESIENGVKVVRVPVFFRKQEAVADLLSMLAFIPMGIKAGKKLLKTNQYDIINTHFVLPTGPVGDVLARFGRIPNILTLHGGDLYEPSKFTSPHRHLLLRVWIRRLLRRADVVIGQSSNTLGNMHHFYTPEIEGVRIPLAIQRPNVDAASRRRYGFEENEILLVTVGRLVARKAIDQLISMMEDLRKEKIHLLIIGTGPQERILKDMCAKKKLESRVIFMGKVEESEKFQILKMCDLYVSTSQHEGFGIVFLEAMASGLPVVCYDHGGQTDFLQDQETGYLVPLNNIDLFKNRCLLLIREPELRKTIGENNKHRVEEFYIDRCASKYESVFSKVLEMDKNERRPRFLCSHIA
jgi:glycosyltransferase involved in cell wall biosynthesis